MAKIRCKVCYDSSTQKMSFFRLEEDAWQPVKSGDKFLGDYMDKRLDVDEMDGWSKEEWTAFFTSLCGGMGLRRRDILVLCVENDDRFYRILDKGLTRCEDMMCIQLRPIDKDAAKALETIFIGIAGFFPSRVNAGDLFPRFRSLERLEEDDVTAMVRSVFKNGYSFSAGMTVAVSELLDAHRKFDFDSREELDEELGKTLMQLSCN